MKRSSKSLYLETRNTPRVLSGSSKAQAIDMSSGLYRTPRRVSYMEAVEVPFQSWMLEQGSENSSCPTKKARCYSFTQTTYKNTAA